jgi:ribonucleoside-triphosphate reductase
MGGTILPRKAPRISTDVFNAVSAPTRIQILKLLTTKGPLSYSEIMEMLNLEPAKDAGKFVYHLRNLLSTGLIDLESETKKYKITDLGIMVVNFSENLEEYALKEAGKLLVRTSRYTIEEFDRSKITQVLIKEANVPADLAEKISAEAEERLLKLPVKYLTAPLIREFVNSILIEKGFEEYRHKLTRLGMPVYDVTETIQKIAKDSLNAEYVHAAAGNQVMTEYMLLNALPREIADAHLAGQIHICNSNYWVLKPNNIYHDLRFFLINGLKLPETNLLPSTLSPPNNIADALLLILGVLDSFSREVSGEQMIDYFNLFLAPYMKSLPKNNFKELLDYFLGKLSFNIQKNGKGVTLGLEVTVPRHLQDLPAIGPGGKKAGKYGDFEEEAREILKLILEVATAKSTERPLFNPHLLLKLRNGCFSEKFNETLKRAHEIAAKYGLLYFANLTKNWQETATYMATGERIEADWTKDWEIDTVRTGSLDNITINLPRIAYEARKNDSKFFNLLTKNIEIADRALEIKNKIIAERMNQKLLPNISLKTDGETYYRLMDSTRTISLIGLNEAIKAHVGYQINEDPIAQNFAIEIMQSLTNFVSSISKRPEKRMVTSQISDDVAPQRLAEHDVEKYGWSIIYTQGEKENPFYTSTTIIPNDTPLSLSDRLRLEEKFHLLSRGGHFMPILLESETSGDMLLKQTKEICQNYDIGLFAYSFMLSYCNHCTKTYFGFLQRCPNCGLTSLIHYGRQATEYIPLLWWATSHKANLMKKL